MMANADAQSRAVEAGANLTDVLAAVIGKAFEREREFLIRFWRGDPNDELMECYMASDRTRIAVLVSSGATVTDTIPTSEFIEWAEAANVQIEGQAASGLSRSNAGLGSAKGEK